MRKRFWLWIGGASAVLLTIGMVARFTNAGTKIHLTQPCGVSDRPSISQVDHTGYDALLQRYVDARGRVAYGKWKSNPRDLRVLDDYLQKIGCIDRRKPASKQARLAFWINAYNALTLRGILREYPTSSIRNHTAKVIGYNIWKDLLLWVDGQFVSLDDIEHRILRKMGEPRIHFAVNCASIGCPQLANRAYVAERLDEQLSANARRFFSQRDNFQVDVRSRTVFVSQLLQWYGSDFASSPVEQIRLLRQFLPNADHLAWLENTDFRVRYQRYDWGLNDQNPVSR